MNTHESSITQFGFNGLFTTEVAEVYALFSKTTVGNRGFILSICKDPGAGKEKRKKEREKKKTKGTITYILFVTL